MKFKYKDLNFDNTLILGTIVKVAYEDKSSLSDEEVLILHSIKRTNQEFSNFSTSEIGNILSEYDEEPDDADF